MKGEIERASAGHEADATTREHRMDEEGSEPSYSQVVASGSRTSLRPSVRPSVRPSAFGPPRVSLLPKAKATAEDGADEENEPAPFPTAPPRARAQEAESPRDEATPSGTRKRAHTTKTSDAPAETAPKSQAAFSTPADLPARATFRADLEDLLPFVSPKSSVPPTLPALPERPARVPDSKRNRLSLLFFGAMLLASAVPLARYATSKTSAPERAPADAPEAKELPEEHETAAAQPSVSQPLPEKLPADPMLEALAQAESDLPEDPAAAADHLLRLGLKALAAGDERYAEALLGRALKRDDDNPRAYFALARIRLSQGNLQGAEGWIVSALHKRPRRAEYHALYATVLERLGRRDEAAQARARARALRGERSE